MILRLGDSGTNVKILQNNLNLIGYGLTIDGFFGSATLAAVKAFQSSHALTIDGIVGPDTQNALLAATVPHAFPTTGILHGGDFYHGDVISSWELMVKSGLTFAFLKASEGLGIDSKFVSYWHASQAAGLIVGAYHFMHFDADPIAQAKLFKSALDGAGGLVSSNLPPVIDWEYSKGNPSIKDVGIAKAFIDEIASLAGRRPIIYGSPSVFNEVGNPGWLSEYPNWIAEYGVSSPRVPKPWNSWNFWQTSESASIPGLSNPGDTNLFNGSLSDLKAL